MDDSEADQRLPHHLEPAQFVSLEELAKLGVLHWNFEPEHYESNANYHKLKEERGYSFEDQIEVSPERLPDYERKIKSFYEEHIHSDEEIRYVLDGSGYFDVRDLEDRWIRIEVSRGDMIVLPAGIFHRFTLDTKNYIRALRLFVGEPVWTPHPRHQLDAASSAHVQSYRARAMMARDRRE